MRCPCFGQLALRITWGEGHAWEPIGAHGHGDGGKWFILGSSGHGPSAKLPHVARGPKGTF